MARTTAETPIRPNINNTAASENYNWRILFRNALIITRREVLDSFRDWRILAPIIILTFIFPFLATFVAQQFFDFILANGGEEFTLIGDRTIPFLLMVVGFFPISISLVIALETFVGEKERRSLEPLLSTPLTNTELYVGKTLAAMIPPLVASYGGMIVYSTMLLFGELQWRPQPMLLVQIFVLTTVQALVMVSGSVVVSSQTTSTRAANLLASFIIIPMTLAIQGESFVMFIAPDAESPYGIFSLWMIILAMIVVVVLFLRVGNTIFNREELLGRTIDELNLRGTFKRMWQNTLAVDAQLTPAKNPLDWYARGVLRAIRELRAALWITVGCFVVALIGGFVVGNMPQYQLPLPQDAEMMGGLAFVDDLFQTNVQIQAVGWLFISNLRILAAALILAVLSFGVAALLLTPAVFVISGYLYTQIAFAGYPLTLFFAGILTHGWIEIPVIVLAAAAAFQLGAVVTRPPSGQTVGAAWMHTFGNTMKIYIGVVVPGLLIAAFFEAFFTPRMVLAVLSGM